MCVVSGAVMRVGQVAAELGTVDVGGSSVRSSCSGITCCLALELLGCIFSGKSEDTA